MKIWLEQRAHIAKPFLAFITCFTILALVSLVLFAPRTVSAGFFSFISGVLNGSNEVKAEVQTSDINSQNIVLLQATKNADPNVARGGGDITIIGGNALLSEAGPSGTLADIEEPKSNQISVYVVRRGDSLSGIAKMFDVSVNTIVWANDISGVIKEGQRLVILPISGIQHTVAKGETIQSIAKKYKGDADEIFKFNGITEKTVLSIGDVITVPDGELARPATVVTTSVARGTSGPSYDGYYIWPVDGGRKTQGIHGYNGVDIGAPNGTPVLASASGTVIISRASGWNGGYGIYTVVAHGNSTQTLYGHLSSLIVYEGQSVVRGQVIGYVGSTGRSTGPHLHFEVRGATNPFR